MKFAENKKIISMIDLADGVRLGMSSPDTYKDVISILNRILSGESISNIKDDKVRDNWQSLKRMKRG